MYSKAYYESFFGQMFKVPKKLFKNPSYITRIGSGFYVIIVTIHYSISSFNVIQISFFLLLQIGLDLDIHAVKFR